MEIVLDDYMKTLCNLNDFVGDCIVKCKKDYLFIDFIVSRKFKKFNKQFCKRNNIDIKFDRLNKIILKMRNESYYNYIDYVITTDYYPENFTVFELDYLVRCCMLLIYLKQKDIHGLFLDKDSIKVDFYFINNKDLRWIYSTNSNKLDTIIAQNHDIKILYRNIEYRTFSYRKCYY